MPCKSVSTGEIHALINLLGDADDAIRDLAKRKLLELGDGVKAPLKAFAATDAEGVLRIEVHRILHEIQLGKLSEKFSRLNAEADLDLEAACFILAQSEYATMDVAHYVQCIDGFAEAVAEQLGNAKTGLRRINRINDYLFKERGFRGNSEDYYDPQNSFINRVLDRQLGIPISLSAIYLFVARRLGLPVAGVGFPGHFLLKYESLEEQFYIDPFNEGKILKTRDCAYFLTKLGYASYDHYLTPISARDILARMIRNLVLIYQENGQKQKIDNLERIFSDLAMT